MHNLDYLVPVYIFFQLFFILLHMIFLLVHISYHSMLQEYFTTRVCVQRVVVFTVPAGVDEDRGLFHLGEQVLIADLLCLWC